MYDIIIKNARVVDGTGNPWFAADIAVTDGVISRIGKLNDATAKRTIDVKDDVLPGTYDYRNPYPDFIAAPGFIDSHNHADQTVFAGADADSMIMQGVTTLIMGNCGMSSAPVNDKNRSMIFKKMLRDVFDSQKRIVWSTFAEYVEQLRTSPLVCNVATFVGHDAIRQAVVGGVERTVTDSEIADMTLLLREAMDAGAFGLSTGLEFSPARVATYDELKRLVTVVAEEDGMYATHIRNRDQFFERSIEEALQLARDTGVNLELSHLNVKTGAANNAWFRVMELLERARTHEGIDVATECIPYRYGPGDFLAPLPDWLLKDGLGHALELLKDEQVRIKLRTDCDRYWRFIHLGEWERLTFLASSAHPELVGKTFVEISEILRKDPWDCYFDLIIDEGENAEGLHLLGELFSEEHVRDMISHPLFMLSSDAAPAAESGPYRKVGNNIASFSWTAKILGEYVRKEKVLRLEEAVRKMTSFPAQKFALKRRGVLKEGMMADLVIFDPDTILEKGTIFSPQKYPSGIRYVIVNGEIVVDQGTYNRKTNGEFIVRT